MDAAACPHASWMALIEAEVMVSWVRPRISARKIRFFICECCRRLRRWNTEGLSLIADVEQHADDLTSFWPALKAGLAESGRLARTTLGSGVLGALMILGGGPPPELCDDDDRPDFLVRMLDRAARPMARPDLRCVLRAFMEYLASEQASGAYPARVEILCAAYQEIFADPLRPTYFDPTWRTPTVVAVAQAIYDGRRVPNGAGEREVQADQDASGETCPTCQGLGNLKRKGPYETGRRWQRCPPCQGRPSSTIRRITPSVSFADMPILADALEEAGCTNTKILGHCRNGKEHVRGCWALDLILAKS